MNTTTNRNILLPNQFQIPTHRQPKKRETACGVGNGGGLLQSRLHNATESKIFEYPWVVAIFEKTLNIDRPKFVCSGSIIHPKVILSTAAKLNRYVENNKLIKNAIGQLFARAGEHDFKSSDELIADQERDIQRIILHQNYKKFYSGYDISMVIVERKFDIFKINVKPICLPSPEMNFDNELCYTVGWGKDNWGRSGNYQTKLQFIDLPILKDNDCIEKIKNESNNEIVIKQLPSVTLCAGGQSDHKDACKGDSGSPLFCPIKNSTINQYYQVGIVSSGFDCSKSYPGFYTNIPAVRTFIDSIMDQLDFEKDTYKFKYDSIIDDDDDDDDDNDMDVDAYNNDDIINLPAVIETADQNMRAVAL